MALRHLGRVVLCTGSVAAGALVAHLTAPAPPPLSAVHEDLAPPPPVAEPPGLPPEPIAVAPILPTLPADAPDPFGQGASGGMVIAGGTPHRLLLFSFDDGPDHRYTMDLLDTLDALELRALFFLTARRFAGQTPRERLLADIAREIVRRGHVVGSHTMDHVQLPTVSGEALAEQVVGTEQVFARVLGQRPWLIRPPGGGRSARIDAWLASRGYTQVLWNIGTGDFQVRTSDDVLRTFQRVLERRERENAERGGIVLLHDIHQWSVEGFPRIVRWIEERNCELVGRPDEELYDIVEDPRVFFTARAGASPSAEAPPAMPDPAWLDARQASLRERTTARCSHLALR